MTAQEKYNEKQQKINELLKQMESLMKAHADRQSRNAQSWEYVGDLGYVESELDELVSFLKAS